MPASSWFEARGKSKLLAENLTFGALANLSATTDRSRMKRVLPDSRLFPFNLIKLLSKGS